MVNTALSLNWIKEPCLVTTKDERFYTPRYGYTEIFSILRDITIHYQEVYTPQKTGECWTLTLYFQKDTEIDKLLHFNL